MTSKIKEADIVLFIITTASVTAVEASERQGGAVKFEIEMANARKTAGEEMRLSEAARYIFRPVYGGG